MSNINKAAVLNPFSDLTANILDYVPRATTSEFGIVAIGSGINVDALGRIYLDTQEYSDRLAAIEAQAASSLTTQQTEVAAAIAQVNLAQSQTITALTLEVNNLKTDLTDSITATQTDLINRADQLAQDVADITEQLALDKAAFTQEIQDALVYLEQAESVASALRTPRKINGTDFDGRSDITTNAWGATRTFKIGNKTNSINGTSNVDYSLADIGAFPEVGGTIQGNVEVTGTLSVGGTISATLEGTAASAAKLQTPRTIGGVSFNGTTNINLPGVNTAGNQNTSGNAETATKLANARTISLTGGVTGSVSFDGSANASIATAVTGLGVANGIATLDSNGRVPSTQLPSYVDDVLEYLNVAAFPTTGESGKIYVETTGNTTYRWSGSAYVKITSGEVASVAGKTGAVTLTKADVGLTNVDNTSDADKPISSATQAVLNTKVNTSDVIAIANGGTGGTTAAEARANLELGSAALYNIGMDGGQVITVGNSFGLGWNGWRQSYENFTQFLTDLNGKSQFVGINFVSTEEVSPYSAGIYSQTQDTYFYIAAGPFSNSKVVGVSGVGRGVQPFVFRTSRDTWVDGNGFIKIASPVVELYANEIKLNNEAKDQDIVFEKVGVGSYLLKGTTGLAQDGWYIEQPKDSNGNIFHAVDYGTHTNGDIWIKTYEQMIDGTRIVADQTKPIDIKENRFISVRLNPLPEDNSAPINPTVKDNEGNAAPSRLHELVNGVWVISDENAAILEQKRLAAMKPLTRRQFRLTLAMNGYDLNEIEALINQIEDPMQRTIAKIEWQDATDFERTNPTLLMMAELLQLTSEQIDQLWSYGLTL